MLLICAWGTLLFNLLLLVPLLTLMGGSGFFHEDVVFVLLHKLLFVHGGSLCLVEHLLRCLLCLRVRFALLGDHLHLRLFFLHLVVLSERLQLLVQRLLLLVVRHGHRTTPLLQPLRVPESVEGVVAAGAARANAGKHDNLDLLALHERVSEDHCQLRLPERHVLALGSLALLAIQRTQAFFQSQQALVNFRSLLLSVFIVTLAVLSSLTASQVD